MPAPPPAPPASPAGVPPARTRSQTRGGRAEATQPGTVVGLGNACLDTAVRLQRWAAPDAAAPIRRRQRFPGGQIAGALVGCARLGLPARLLLARGADPAGRGLRRALRAAGLEVCDARVVAGASTASALILTGPGGERVVLAYNDARVGLRASDVTAADLWGAAALLLDGRDRDACRHAANLARQRQIPVIADCDEWYPHTLALLPLIDHLIVPEEFLQSAPLAPAALAAAAGGILVVTLGARGALALAGGRRLRAPAVEVAVVDTTGAGDAFRAGYIAALLEGRGLAARLRFANTTAALACTAWGAQSGLPTRPQVLTRLAALPLMIPLLLGHRGHRLRRFLGRGALASALALARFEPENSRAAFDRALAAGCDGLELDLRLSRDGRIVVHHDSALAGVGLLAHHSWRELHRAAPHLMSLDQFLARYHRRAWLDLELKEPGLEDRLLATLRRYLPERGFVVSCFELAVLERVRQRQPDAPLCWNLRRPVTQRRLRAARVPWIAPHQALCTPWYVRRLRAAGWQVLVWTVNRPSQMRALARAGASVLCSDHPDRLVRTVRGVAESSALARNAAGLSPSDTNSGPRGASGKGVK